MTRIYPLFLTRLLLDGPPLLPEQLRDEAVVTSWVTALNERFLATAGHDVRVHVTFDPEHQVHLPMAVINSRGVEQRVIFGQDFFLSADYRGIAALCERLNELVGDGAYVRRGDKRAEVKRFGDALDWLMEQARRGVDIQRYKGLGEMNPEQLWETTMDPASRRLLRTQIEDAITADEIFTTLMGDMVEPRRAFIETNALGVRNLDV